MSFFKIGVVIPIKNHHFIQAHHWNSALNSAVASGSSSITVNNYVPRSDAGGITTDRILQKGNRIILGPSTATSYESKTESIIVKKVSSNTIYLESNTINGYNSGDVISGEGTLCPGGWFPVNGSLSMLGIKQPDYGKSDEYALKFSSRSTANYYVRTHFEYQPFLNSMYYKLGYYYKTNLIPYSSDPFDIYGFGGVRDGISTHESAFSRNISVREWTENTRIFYTNAMVEEQYSGNITTQFGIVRNSGNVKMTIWIDDVYLEHADPSDTKTEILEELYTTGGLTSIAVNSVSGFSIGDYVLISGIVPSREDYPSGFTVSAGDRAQVQGTISSVESSSNELVVNLNSSLVVSANSIVRKKSDCEYTFASEPDNIKNQRITTFKTQITSGQLKGYKATGEHEEFHQISMMFNIVPISFYQTLERYIRYQEDGNMLILHLEGIIPEIDRPFLLGYAQISQSVKDFWDVNYCSFNLSFIGY